MFKKLLLTTITGSLLFFFSCKKEQVTAPEPVADTPQAAIDRNAIVIPAGSVNQLAAALQSGGTVILEAGEHIETGKLLISGYHNIIGRPGAVLRMTTSPQVDYAVPIEVGLHFKNAGNSMLQGVKIISDTPIGGTAVLVENSPKFTVQQCEISGFQYGILVEKSSLVKIFQNKITITSAWQTGDLGEAHGIVIINGTGAVIERNEVMGAFFGIWACDKNGICRKNKLHDNYIGLILCKVPLGGILLPGGEITGAELSCTYWNVRNNIAYNNWTTGYLVIDGANNNTITNNTASGNGTYDYELVGNSYRFGFLTPFCHDNKLTVDAGNTVKDCGQNNTISGGIMINTAIDPCN